MSLSLVKAIFINRAPFEHLVLDFKEKGINVLSAINGKGKTTVLSHIVDAFYELADKGYENATQATSKGHQYYKEIAPAQIRFGQKHMIAHICFQQADQSIEYLFKSGELSFEEYGKSREETVNQKLNWKDETNFKEVTAEGKDATNIFEKNVEAGKIKKDN